MMSLRRLTAWIISVGCDEYDVDEDAGEDDAVGKDNYE